MKSEISSNKSSNSTGNSSKNENFNNFLEDMCIYSNIMEMEMEIEENQDKINDLARKKYSVIKNIHPNVNDDKEKFYHNTLSNLVSKVYDKNYSNYEDEKIPSICNGRIDLLWIYVNSTDPESIKNFEKYSVITNTRRYSNRFRENGSFLFSMRSLLKNLKFIKDYWIDLASQSQISSFINYKVNSDGEYELIYDNNYENISDSDKKKCIS